MYFKYLVKVPDSDAAVTRKRINGITYVYYAYGRTYDPVKKYSVPKNTTIGKCLALDPSMMYPNANYLRFFPNEDPSGEDSEKIRSACLKIGPYVVIKKIVDEYKLRCFLQDLFGESCKTFLANVASPKWRKLQNCQKAG